MDTPDSVTKLLDLTNHLREVTVSYVSPYMCSYDWHFCCSKQFIEDAKIKCMQVLTCDNPKSLLLVMKSVRHKNMFVFLLIELQREIQTPLKECNQGRWVSADGMGRVTFMSISEAFQARGMGEFDEALLLTDTYYYSHLANCHSNLERLVGRNVPALAKKTTVEMTGKSERREFGREMIWKFFQTLKPGCVGPVEGPYFPEHEEMFSRPVPEHPEPQNARAACFYKHSVFGHPEFANMPPEALEVSDGETQKDEKQFEETK